MAETHSGALLLRHWRAALVGVLVTVALAVAAFVLAPAQYEAKALIVLLPATTAGEGESDGGNPYTELGGLDTAAGVLALAMNTEDVADVVARTSPTATFTVEEDESTSGPVLLLTAEDADPGRTLEALDALVEEAGPTLTRLQQEAGAPRDTLITMAVVTRESSASVVRQTQIRIVLGAFVLGLALTAVAVVGLERRARARRGVTAPAAAREQAVPIPSTAAAPVAAGPPVGAVTPPPNNPAPQVGRRGPVPTPRPRTPSPYRRNASSGPRAAAPDGATTAEQPEPTTVLPVAATMPIAALTRVGPPSPGLDGATDGRENGETSAHTNGRGPERPRD